SEPVVYAASHGSPVAQSVEQVTVNHWVGGSSPSRGANSQKKNHLPLKFVPVDASGSNTLLDVGGSKAVPVHGIFAMFRVSVRGTSRGDNFPYQQSFSGFRCLTAFGRG